LKSSNRFVITVVAIIVLVALAFLSQYAPSGGTVPPALGLTQDELNTLADIDLGAREKFELASNPEGRKEYVQQYREFFALANEALRRRLKGAEEIEVLRELGENVALRQSYVEKHSSGAPGEAPPQVAPEEIDDWVAKNTAKVEKIKNALKVGDKPGPPIEGKQLAGLYITADKARAEGVDKDPARAAELALQGKLVLVNILAGTVQETLKTETEFSDADVTAYYNTKAPLGELDVVHAAHVLIPTRPLPSPMGTPQPAMDPAAALALANDVDARAKAGEDFAALAKQYSGDLGSGQQGGDLGSQPLYMYVPEFAEATAKLKPGEISDVVKTEFGYHIIKLIERKPPEPLTPQLQAQLKGQLSQQALKRKVDEIVRNNPPEIPDDFTVTAPASMPPEPPQFELPPDAMMEPGADGEDLDEEEGPDASQKAPAKPGAQPSKAPPKDAPKAPAKPAGHP